MYENETLRLTVERWCEDAHGRSRVIQSASFRREAGLSIDDMADTVWQMLREIGYHRDTIDQVVKASDSPEENEEEKE